jgi:hypothetical protein
MVSEKLCPGCKQTKAKSLFSWSNKAKQRRQTYCKDCKSTKYKSSYSQNYSYKERNKARWQLHRQRLDELKATMKCIACPEREPVCLDFHHMDASEKEFGISASLARNWNLILEEIAKCVVICANCHRKFHNGKLNIEDYSKDHYASSEAAALSKQ